MFASVRKYQIDPRNSKTVDLKIKKEFLPLLQKVAGFIGYYWLDDGNGKAVSVSIFETALGGSKSNEIAMDYGSKNLKGLISMPEVVDGEIQAYSSTADEEAELAPEVHA